ncbi:unnamed protein product [Prunus armeniaca]
MSGVAADTALRLSAAQPPAPPFLSTSDTTAGTSPQLPAVLPPTPPFLSTSDTTTSTSPQLPAVPPRGEIIDDSPFFDGGAKILRSIDELLPFFLGILHSFKVVFSWLGDQLSWRVVLFPWRP